MVGRDSPRGVASPSALCRGVCVPGTHGAPRSADVCYGAQRKTKRIEEKTRREGLVTRAIYTNPRADTKGTRETTKGAWLHLAGSRLTVMVAPDNVSGFVPPMDLPPFQQAVSYEGSRHSIKGDYHVY